MTDNSAACELYHGQPGWTPGVSSLYTIPDKLFELKEQLETHLCQRTDHLFNLRNSIALFDLTNFYFEGSKRGSRMAKFGRSKEKRSDCKLLVLALCINAEGFIRYSSILEGNTAAPQSLPDMIEKLSGKSPAALAHTSSTPAGTALASVSPSRTPAASSMPSSAAQSTTPPPRRFPSSTSKFLPSSQA